MRFLFVLLIATVALVTPSRGRADDGPHTWAEYQAAHSLTCWAKDEPLAPQVAEYAGYRYTFAGTTAKVERLHPRAGSEITLGVLSGIKELDAKTKATLDTFIARFKSAGAEAILVGGDNAEDEENLAAVFEYLGTTELPTYIVIGNWEGRAPFNRALANASAQHPNLINMQLVRRLDAEGYDVISLGGYFDRQFVRNSGGCAYAPEDVDYLQRRSLALIGDADPGSEGRPCGRRSTGATTAVGTLAKQANDPVILLMHGPPRQKGKEALDYVPDTGNVGDPELAKVIAEVKIPFGIHGHILEAGLKATDLGGKPVPAGKLQSSLFVNPGAVSSLPWKLNSGKTDYGSAALLTLKGKHAKVEWLVAPKPE